MGHQDWGREVKLFSSFCRQNIQYWTIDSNNKQIDSNQIILVDLIVRGGWNLIRPIILAKFLQNYYGCKVVGLIGETDLTRGIYRDPRLEVTKALATSYGIDEFICVNTPPGEDFPIRVSLQDKYSELSSFDLTEEIAGLGEDEAKERILSWRSHSGTHIGKHILTSAERTVYSPRFEVYSKILPRTIKETLFLHNYFEALFQRYDVCATVATHTCYNVWGLLGEISLQRGTTFFHSGHDSNLSVAVLREPPSETETLGSLMRRAEASVFHDWIWPNRAKLRATTDRVMGYVNSGDHLAPPWWAKHRKDAGDRPSDRRSVMRRLGWLEDRPVYSVLNHAMTDDVHPDTQAFDDYRDWLGQTLAFAADDDSRYWLVKRHPHDSRYDDTATFDELVGDYAGFPHIRFIADDLTKEELFEVTSLALTVRGSLGFDFAAAGIPVVLSGRSRMSDIGFASVADDVETYFSLLRKPLADLAMTPEQVERARLYIMCNRLVMQVPSGFLPSLNVSRDQTVWADLSRRLVTANVETDNLYRNIVRCLELGLPWVVNIEFLQLVNESRNFEPHAVEAVKAHA